MMWRLLRAVQRGGELSARADPELAIDARQVRLHRSYRHVKLRRDLLVRATGGDERGDARLRLGQAARPRRAAAADSRLLVRCTLGPEPSTEPVESLLRGEERLACCPLLL